MKKLRDKVHDQLIEEAQNIITDSHSVLLSKMYIKFYMELAFAVGVDVGILLNNKHFNKPICAYNSREYIEYPGVRLAARLLKIDHVTILRHIKSKTFLLGYKWEYLKKAA